MQLEASRSEVSEKTEEDLKIPHLLNINEDSMLTGKIKHVLKEGLYIVCIHAYSP